MLLRGAPAELLSDNLAFDADADALVSAVENLTTVGMGEERSTEVALDAIDGLFDDLNDQMASLLAALLDRQSQTNADTAAARRLAARVVIGASLVGVIVAMVLLRRTMRSILSGLGGVSDAAAALAAGDMAARVDNGRSDEIGAVGSAFNATADAMQAIVGRLADQARRAFAVISTRRSKWPTRKN